MNDDLQTLDDCFAQMSDDLSLIADLVHPDEQHRSSSDRNNPWQPITPRTDGRRIVTWTTVHHFAPVEQL